jgi:L-ascorbate metabolism protein UlaG (beta-lactamase superfamily)
MVVAMFSMLFVTFTNSKAESIPKDTFQTSEGTLEVFHVGHASLYFVFNGKTIHVDPFGTMGDYSKMPKADLILITHDHPDHLDAKAIELISKENTQIIINEAGYDSLQKGKIMKNGEQTTVLGLPIKAVPAYNIVHKQEDGTAYHPKGRGNGYVVKFGNTSVYIAGDTENIPEMKNLGDIDIAFLPMNLPYTMSPEMCKEAALMVQPKILFPYHYKMGETDTEKFARLMEDVSGIEVRFRQ